MRLTNEQLDELAFHLPHVRAWLNAVEAELLRELEAGASFENVKLEPKRANRKWCLFVPQSDSDSLDAPVPFDPIKFLRKFSKLDVVAPRVPLSPTQAEKTLGAKVYSQCSGFVVRESSGMKLAYTHPEETTE